MMTKMFSNRQSYGLAAASGVLLGVAFPPFGLWAGLLAFVALVPLLIALENVQKWTQAFKRAFIAMFLLGLVANYWVGGWKGEGEVDPFLMLGGVMLAFVHPFFLVIPAVLYDGIRRKFSRKAALISLPFLWTGFEYWHSFGDLGYPWLNLYNTQTYNLPFAQFIEFTGSYGLSTLIVIINVLIYAWMWRDKENSTAWWKYAFALFFAFGIPYAYGFYAMNSDEVSSGKATVAVIQPNLNPWAKWELSNYEVMRVNVTATNKVLQQHPDSIDFVLWPETAITFPITLPNYSSQLRGFENYLRGIHTPILTGFPDYEQYGKNDPSIPEDAKPNSTGEILYRSWNAAMLASLDDQGVITYQRYHKQILVPLGEHVPFIEIFPFLGKIFKWGVGLGSWNRGEGYNVFSLPIKRPEGKVDSAKIWTMICYESVYPAFVRHFVANGANLLTVITNDGWYGKSAGPYQHNQYAALRAIENRRWIARSANTGISSFIDDRGRFIQQTPLFEDASIVQTIPLISRKTLYVLWGDYVAIPCLVFTAIVAAYMIAMKVRSRKRRKKELKEATIAA